MNLELSRFYNMIIFASCDQPGCVSLNIYSSTTSHRCLAEVMLILSKLVFVDVVSQNVSFIMSAICNVVVQIMNISFLNFLLLYHHYLIFMAYICFLPKKQRKQIYFSLSMCRLHCAVLCEAWWSMTGHWEPVAWRKETFKVLPVTLHFKPFINIAHCRTRNIICYLNHKGQRLRLGLQCLLPTFQPGK